MKMMKEASIDELDGVILKHKVGYSLNQFGKRTPITRVGLLKLIEEMDVEKHNEDYLRDLKNKLEVFDEDGYNFLGFNKEGIHLNGTEFSDANCNSQGWRKIEDRYNSTERSKLYYLNTFTGTEFDLNGFDMHGIDKDGFNVQGLDKDGYGKDGYNEKGFNRKKLHKDTGTKYNLEGYDEDGRNAEGYNVEGLNDKGKTKEEVENDRKQRVKNFLGLIDLAQKYSKSQISTEEYMKNHKITIEELISFAKSRKMPSTVIIGLNRKRQEYNRYRAPFIKSEYLKSKTTINGVEITEEIVDKALEYLKDNDRLICRANVVDTLRQFSKGEVQFEQQKSEEKLDVTDKINTSENSIDVAEEVESRDNVENRDKLEINSLKGSLENAGVTRSEVANEAKELSERAKCHSQDIESVKKDEQGGQAI